MQRHIPLGYSIQNGRAVIQPETAEIVRKVFEAYLNGTSTYRIAKELTGQRILNASGQPSWNHGSVGKILDNCRYLGDELYLPMIELGTFEQVQERRKQKAEELGRTAQVNSFANRSIWSRLLKCGECGQPYHKYTEKGKPTRWKCKHYIYHNRVCCRNDFLSQEELEEAFIQAVNRVIEEPGYLKDDFPKAVIPQSAEEHRLDNRIHEKLSETACDAQNVKLLAYRRAVAAYQRAEADGYAYYNEKMKRVLEGFPRQTACDLTLLEQTIERIVVQKQAGLNFCFKNGRSILIPKKEGR